MSPSRSQNGGRGSRRPGRAGRPERTRRLSAQTRLPTGRPGAHSPGEGLGAAVSKDAIEARPARRLGRNPRSHRASVPEGGRGAGGGRPAREEAAAARAGRGRGRARREPGGRRPLQAALLEAALPQSPAPAAGAPGRGWPGPTRRLPRPGRGGGEGGLPAVSFSFSSAILCGARRLGDARRGPRTRRPGPLRAPRRVGPDGPRSPEGRRPRARGVGEGEAPSARPPLRAPTLPTPARPEVPSAARGRLQPFPCRTRARVYSITFPASPFPASRRIWRHHSSPLPAPPFGTTWRCSIVFLLQILKRRRAGCSRAPPPPRRLPQRPRAAGRGLGLPPPRLLPSRARRQLPGRRRRSQNWGWTETGGCGRKPEPLGCCWPERGLAAETRVERALARRRQGCDF